MEKKLEFTDSANNQIDKITKRDGKKYFRIAVQGGGCSGFKYNFTFDDKTFPSKLPIKFPLRSFSKIFILKDTPAFGRKKFIFL